MRLTRGVNLLLLCLLCIPQAFARDNVLKHADSVMRAHLDSLAESSVLKANREKTSKDLEQVGYTLGLIQAAIRNSDTKAIASELNHLRTLKVPASLEEVKALVVASALQMLKDFDGAADTLAPFTRRHGSSFARQIAARYLRNLIDAGLTGEAFRYFYENQGYLERALDRGELDESKLLLAKSLEKSRELPLARPLFRELAQGFPMTSASVEAYYSVQRQTCELGDDAEPWEDSEAKRTHAKDILYYLGPLPDVRALALSFAGVSEKEIASLNEPILDADKNEELLRKLEFLVSIREYALAEKLARYLKKSFEKAHAPGLEPERLYFFIGRAMNSANKPAEAAAAYHKLWSTYPHARLASQARSRHALSMQYAGEYKKAARLFRALPKSSSKKTTAAWNAFWSEYLAGDLKSALRDARQLVSSKKFDPDIRIPAKYWLARTYERAKDKPQAVRLLQELKRNSNNSFYGQLARWRLAVMRDSKAQLEGKSPAFGSNALRVWKRDFSLPTELSPKLTFVNSLLNFGLHEYAALELENAATQIRDEREAATIAKLAFRAQNYKVTSLIPRRTVWNLRSIPSREDALVKELGENNELWRLSYPLAFGPVVEEMARRYYIDPFLVFSVMRAESNFDLDAESPVGAIGILQIMPQTGTRIASVLGIESFNPRQLLKPEVSIAFASWYLGRLVAHYHDNVALAVAAYNAGPEAVDRWIAQNPHFEIDEFLENIPFKETKHYVGRVLSNLDMYQRIYSSEKLGFALAMSSGTPKPKNESDLF